MTKNSNIEWTHHTFNPWRGCSKVSQGCKHCYADTLSHRNPAVLGIWGPNGSRPIAAESYWKQPIAWNKAAEQAGERHRVFCASLADVFEGPETMPADAVDSVNAARTRLFELIKQTPHLDWLFLTKRPENIAAMLPSDWAYGYPNVWLGTSVENQDTANARIAPLLAIPARVRFLSCEPLLGALDFGEMEINGRLHWIIVGGESGTNARPMHPNWALNLLGWAHELGIDFFFKQWGEWVPWSEKTGPAPEGRPAGFFSNADVWHAGTINTFRQSMVRVGKKAAGRILDDEVWDDVPTPLIDPSVSADTPRCPNCAGPVELLENDDYWPRDKDGELIDTDDWSMEELHAYMLRDPEAWNWVCDTCCCTCPDIPIPPYVDEEEEALKKMQMVMDL